MKSRCCALAVLAKNNHNFFLPSLHRGFCHVISAPVLDLPPPYNDSGDVWFDVQSSNLHYSEFIKDVHDMTMSKMYKLKNGALSSDDMAGQITLEKNGKVLDFFPGSVSTDHITAIQEAYRDMASAVLHSLRLMELTILTLKSWSWW